MNSIANNINNIVRHWTPDLMSGDEKFKERVTAVREMIDPKINSDRLTTLQHFDDPKEMDAYWFIFSKCGEHYSEINNAHYYCSCHSFECSGKGMENKKPCKHLYALATWQMRNY
tara:strand:- start:677 stop:1021 length:345 start_codon:yes stop_codon:yes gene_type:complete